MKQKLCLKPLLLLLTVYFLFNLQQTWATQALGTQPWEFPSPCYIAKSNAAGLLNRIDNTLKLLSPGDEYLQQNNNVPVIQVPLGFLGLCTQERIARIQNDVAQVAGRLAPGQSELPVEGNTSWNNEKWQLIHDLKAIRVYYDSSFFLYPFLPLVQHLDHIMDQAKTVKPTSLPLLTPVTPVKLDIHRPKYCTGQITTTETERDRISSLLKQQTEFLLNALESEMASYAKSVPHLKLVSTAFYHSFEGSRTHPFSLTNPPQCNINGTIFKHWNKRLNMNIKQLPQLQPGTEIQLSSDPPTCFTIFKAAHSAVSVLQSSVEKLYFWHENCTKSSNLKNAVRSLKHLLLRFSEQLTELHRMYKRITTEVINMEKNVDCLGPVNPEIQTTCFNNGIPSDMPGIVIHGYVEPVNDEDKIMESSAELEEEYKDTGV